MGQLDQNQLTLPQSTVNSPEAQSESEEIKIVNEEKSKSMTDCVSRPSVSDLNSDKVCREEPVDRWQEIDKKLLN